MQILLSGWVLCGCVVVGLKVPPGCCGVHFFLAFAQELAGATLLD